METIGNAKGIGNFEFDAITSVDINSQKVFRDVAFSWSKRFSIGGSATVDIVIDPTNVDDERVLVVLPVSFTAYGAGPINIDFYFGVTSSENGTLWAGANRDGRSSTASNVSVRLSPTVGDVGSKLPFEFMIPSDGVPAVASIGGQAKDDMIFIARNDGKYMFRLVNTEASEAKCVFAMTMFEAIKGK